MRKVFSIALVTFQEISRDRIFYSFLAFFFVLLGASYLASQLSFVASSRIVLDFGNTISFFGLSLFAATQGASMIAKEYERQTIQLAQSKPLTEFQFLLGKWVGFSGVVFVNVVFLMLVEWFTLWILGASVGGAFFVSFLFVFLNALLLASISIFFISFTTVTLSIVFTIGVLVLGSTTTEFINVFGKIESAEVRGTLMALIYLFPSFEPFNLGHKLTYSLPIRAQEVIVPILYSLSYTAFFLFVSSRLIRKKEY